MISSSTIALCKRLLPRAGPPERWKETPSCIIRGKPYEDIMGNIHVTHKTLPLGNYCWTNKGSKQTIFVLPDNKLYATCLNEHGVLTHKSLFAGLQRVYKARKPASISTVYRGPDGPRCRLVFPRVSKNGTPEVAVIFIAVDSLKPRPFTLTIPNEGDLRIGDLVVNVLYKVPLERDERDGQITACHIDYTWDLATEFAIMNRSEILHGATRTAVRPDGSTCTFRTPSLFEGESPTVPGSVHRFKNMGHRKPDGTRGELIAFARIHTALPN